MLYASFYRVHPEQVQRLRDWMKELERRRPEALESYRQEGARHELAYLIEGQAGPVLVYLAEVEDLEKARAAFQSSQLPIDLEHREVMHGVVLGRADVELLYECLVDGESGGAGT
jgi:hypothetical protein